MTMEEKIKRFCLLSPEERLKEPELEQEIREYVELVLEHHEPQQA